MKLNITICHSIIKMCLEVQLNGISRFNRQLEETDPGSLVLKQIKRRKITFCIELEEKILEYFDKNEPEFKQVYQDYVTSLINDEEHAFYLNNYTKDPLIDSITTDEYLNTLLNVAFQTEDKIVFSQLLDTYKSQACQYELNIMNKNDILDRSKDTILNRYTMSRVREFSTADQISSLSISIWLARFWKNEKNFTIIDSYIIKHKDSFKKYVLDYIPNGANVNIYTLRDKQRNSDFINAFKNHDFSSWNIDIFIYESKTENHDRCIITDNYHIQINNLLGAFDYKGTSFVSQVTITPNYKTNVDGIDKRPLSRKIT